MAVTREGYQSRVHNICGSIRGCHEPPAEGGRTQFRGPKADDGLRHPACGAFMDDITVMTPSIQGTKWILSSLRRMASWARMYFKPGKSRSLCIVRGLPSFSASSFLADLLATPSNLKTWGKEEGPSCKRCSTTPCSWNHILAGCTRVVHEGHYRWGHDKVLMAIAKWTEIQRVKANNHQAPPPRAISFLGEGQKTLEKTSIKSLPSV